MSNELLKQYIERLSKLPRNTTLQAEDLKTIALEVGLSPADIERAEKNADTQVERGNNYAQQKLYNESIQAYQEALSLSPLRIPVMLSLAEVYHQRSLQHQTSDADWQACKDMARRCIELDASCKRAYELLALPKPSTTQANTNSTTPANTREPQHQSTSNRRYIVLFAIILGLLVVYATTLSTPKALPQRAVSPAPLPDVTPKPLAVTEITPLSPNEKEIPVSVVDKSGLFQFATRLSRVNHYDGFGGDAPSSYHKLGIDALLVAKQELQQADLLCLYKDASGKTLQSDSIKILDDYEGKRLPGDELSVYHLQKTSRELASIQCEVQGVSTSPAASQYPPAKPLALEGYDINSSAQKVTIAERSQNTSVEKYITLNLVFENIGETAIKQFVIAIEFLGTDGSVRKSEKTYLVAEENNSTSMLPQKRRTYSGTYQKPTGFASYRLRMLDIE